MIHGLNKYLILPEDSCMSLCFFFPLSLEVFADPRKLAINDTFTVLLLLDFILDVFGNYWYLVSFKLFPNFLLFVSEDTFVFEFVTNVLNLALFMSQIFFNFWLLSFRALMTLRIFLFMKTLPVFGRFEYNFVDYRTRFVFGRFQLVCAVVELRFFFLFFLDLKSQRFQVLAIDFFIRDFFFEIKSLTSVLLLLLCLPFFFLII